LAMVRSRRRESEWLAEEVGEEGEGEDASLEVSFEEMAVEIEEDEEEEEEDEDVEKRGSERVVVVMVD